MDSQPSSSSFKQADYRHLTQAATQLPGAFIRAGEPSESTSWAGIIAVLQGGGQRQLDQRSRRVLVDVRRGAGPGDRSSEGQIKRGSRLRARVGKVRRCSR